MTAAPAAAPYGAAAPFAATDQVVGPVTIAPAQTTPQQIVPQPAVVQDPFLPAPVAPAFAPPPNPLDATENPYMAPTAAVERSEADSTALYDMVLAGRGTRLAAQILNGLVLVVPMMILMGVTGQFADVTDPDQILSQVGWMAALAAVPIVIINLYLLAQSGQSIGKKLLSIRIVRSDGSPANLLRLVFLRYVAMQGLGLIPILGSMISLLDALFIFGEPRRCIHDYFADTIVVTA